MVLILAIAILLMNLDDYHWTDDGKSCDCTYVPTLLHHTESDAHRGFLLTIVREAWSVVTKTRQKEGKALAACINSDNNRLYLCWINSKGYIIISVLIID